ncbi:MAG: hypothetical protein J7J07_09200 [Syntrophobacterales bacterium]|nr:hypothetical protein [Syntrophobacterales bacterium]
MLKKDLILKNPLSLLGCETEDIVHEGGFGAVLSRAGVGKTAFLVQLAINSMLRSKNVLHISLNDPVKKVGLWYKELFHNLAEQHSPAEIKQLWEDILPHRFIMTFKVEGFSVPRLGERITDLTEQNIFHPRMIIIDGFRFNESTRKPLIDLKGLAEKHEFNVWFTVTTHRNEEPEPDGMPISFSLVEELFDAVLKLWPEGAETHIKILKGISADNSSLLLDSSTMLVKDKN